jgi:hypothetical protein
MAATMALILVATRYLGTIGVWRRTRASTRTAELPLRDALRATFAKGGRC